MFGQQATVGGQAVAQDKGPLCTGKNVQRCLRVVRKSAAPSESREAIDQPSLAMIACEKIHCKIHNG